MRGGIPSEDRGRLVIVPVEDGRCSRLFRPAIQIEGAEVEKGDGGAGVEAEAGGAVGVFGEAAEVFGAGSGLIHHVHGPAEAGEAGVEAKDDEADQEDPAEDRADQPGAGTGSGAHGVDYYRSG